MKSRRKTISAREVWKLESGSRPYPRTFELWRMVQGNGDAGSYHEYHAQGIFSDPGWLRLTKMVLRKEALIRRLQKRQ